MENGQKFVLKRFKLLEESHINSCLFFSYFQLLLHKLQVYDNKSARTQSFLIAFFLIQYALCVCGSKGRWAEFAPKASSWCVLHNRRVKQRQARVGRCNSLTCFLLGVKIPPVHPVFVVILGGIQVRVQAPFLFSAKAPKCPRRKSK